ncbi:hypothetical protein Ade02nite_70140 [Paractinoplanes deccanensis]|uniref:Uncharacterized protein n=1 Tax=Paractinoplanes deccanensis TaxID=113561 RepID=A0ABQ3YEG4_9ACTN|nr:hypothetical protein [Actinoplanes deccanensis]GID78373.1 hypothetical protein Ade02nite_70140 [Actinoplanes deccanensis]
MFRATGAYRWPRTVPALLGSGAPDLAGTTTKQGPNGRILTV